MQIGASDVKAFLRHPAVPRDVLEDIYQMLRIMLNKSADQVDSDQEIPSAVISAREQMYYDEDSSSPTGLPAVSSAAPPAALKSTLKAQVEAPIKGEGLKPDSAVAEVTYTGCDKYGDGFVLLKDKAYESFIRSTYAKCQEQGLYFPYGFGNGKNQLKVKKLNLGATAKDTTLTLKFSRWDVNGKSGFSCYADSK